MKSIRNAEVRLTDELERRLMQEAIASQYDHVVEEAFKSGVQKIARLFKSVAHHERHVMRPAH